MSLQTTANTNDKLQALLEKQRAIRAALVREQLKRKKKEFREFQKLKDVIGGALLAAAAEDTTFAVHLKERLQKVAMTDSEKSFLRSKGWA